MVWYKYEHIHIVHVPLHSVLMDFDDEGCSESLTPTEDDPSIAFSPGPADVAERYLWKRDSEIHLHQRQPCRVRSKQERTKIASKKCSQSQRIAVLTTQQVLYYCSTAT